MWFRRVGGRGQKARDRRPLKSGGGGGVSEGVGFYANLTKTPGSGGLGRGKRKKNLPSYIAQPKGPSKSSPLPELLACPDMPKVTWGLYLSIPNHSYSLEWMMEGNPLLCPELRQKNNKSTPFTVRAPASLSAVAYVNNPEPDKTIKAKLFRLVASSFHSWTQVQTPQVSHLPAQLPVPLAPRVHRECLSSSQVLSSLNLLITPERVRK